jgi:hypothetical protein
MPIPGGLIQIPRPTGFEDIEVVTILRYLNGVPAPIELELNIGYTDTGSEEGDTRESPDIIYEDTAPGAAGDTLQYEIIDFYDTDTSIMYPTDPFTLQEAAIYPGSQVQIPIPDDLEDVELVNIYRILNSVQTLIKPNHPVDYSDSGAEEGATRETPSGVLYTDTVPLDAQAGDTLRYYIKDVFSDEAIYWPAYDFEISDRPIFSFSVVSQMSLSLRLGF